MLINENKTKAMLFNYTEKYQFTTRLQLNENTVEVIDQTRLLGTVISNDLKWDVNTKSLVKKANARMEGGRVWYPPGGPKDHIHPICKKFTGAVRHSVAQLIVTGKHR
jgi:hypothetical protein